MIKSSKSNNAKSDNSKKLEIFDTISNYKDHQKTHYPIKLLRSTDFHSKKSKQVYKILKKIKKQHEPRKIKFKDILNVYNSDLIEENDFSYLEIHEVDDLYAYDLRKKCCRLFLRPTNFPEKIYKIIKSCILFQCIEKPKITLDVSKESITIINYLIAHGPISYEKWANEFDISRNDKTISMVLDFCILNEKIDLRALSPVAIWIGFLQYCREYLKDFIDFEILGDGKDFFVRKHFSNYKRLLRFRDLTFLESRRYLLNKIMKFLHIQMRHKYFTGWNFSKGVHQLKLAMIPGQYYKYSHNITDECDTLWFVSLLKQGRIKYLPTWVEDFGIFADSDN